MAKRKSLKALVKKQGAEARDDGRWVPEDGQKFPFKVVAATTKLDKNGYPSFNLKIECTKGDDKGRSAWARFNASEEYSFITHRMIDGFAALGVAEDDVWDNEELVCEMVKNKTGVAITSIRESDNPHRPFVNFEFEASRVTKPVVDDDDEDDEEEEAPKPKRRAKKAAAKKTTKKAAAKRRKPKPKPEPEPEPEEDDEDEDFEDDDTFDPDDESDEEDEEEETYEDEDEDDWEYPTDDDEYEEDDEDE